MKDVFAFRDKDVCACEVKTVVVITVSLTKTE